MMAGGRSPELLIALPGVTLAAELGLPHEPRAIVAFAHGSGSSRHSRRNQQVAAVLREAGYGTLLLDLLTAEEEAVDQRTRHLRFDIGLLAERMIGIVDWLERDSRTQRLPIAMFGASTGAAAALVAAAERPTQVAAVVSRGGRPDLAGASLGNVHAPTLLIVGGADTQVLALNREAMVQIPGPVQLAVVPGATHLFEEPGALEQVARLAADHLRATIG
jgi:putative phosphoribosyl transferase